VKEHQETWDKNGVGVCRTCHDAIHRHEPGTEMYRIAMWQEVTDVPLRDDQKL
jgi:hypothetical protein